MDFIKFKAGNIAEILDIILGDGPPIDAPVLDVNMKYIYMFINEYLVIVAGVVATTGALCAVICIIFNVTYRNAT